MGTVFRYGNLQLVLHVYFVFYYERLHAVVLVSLSGLGCLVELVACPQATVHVHIFVYSFEYKLCAYLFCLSVWYCIVTYLSV